MAWCCQLLATPPFTPEPFNFQREFGAGLVFTEARKHGLYDDHHRQRGATKNLNKEEIYS